jgi:hypothetical protein
VRPGLDYVGVKLRGIRVTKSRRVLLRASQSHSERLFGRRVNESKNTTILDSPAATPRKESRTPTLSNKGRLRLFSWPSGRARCHATSLPLDLKDCSGH